ncbi:MAG: PIN domain-containing protein [bacterium]
MDTFLLDTNILIRVITGDDPKLSPKARQIIEKAVTANYKLVVTPIIVAECLYVLTSKALYGLSRDKSVLALQVVLNLKNLVLEEKEALNLALEIYQNHNIDFADCYLLAKNEVGIYSGIKTFDEKILGLV